ncbi:hypothetical protein V9T40_002495 [Parthenolecanium corni]|uniref:CCR4-NOT transcription complex subunit 3 n=1 Tax=Parthenolecanium corni TaxID=536013 RepID=A0AAN9Y4I5_9HEMI
MAASRKLQGEIDRCLKKVSEGVETFEDTWQKVHNATNANQKEKYEADLKKEIKKLQRLRDQIKSWIASGEIKDKSNLLEYRKLIETQMERFKVVERETKTKAYSKEGLGAAQKLDPAQKEKEEISTWLVQAIDALNLQVDQFESEIESLIAGGKKKRVDKDKQDRVDGLKSNVEKHRFHIKKLETILRMLDNMSVEVNQVKKIKDDIEYYIESSQDADFQENEYIYDDIEGIDDVELTGIAVAGSANTDSNGTPTSMTSSPAHTSPLLQPPLVNPPTDTTTTTVLTEEKKKEKLSQSTPVTTIANVSVTTNMVVKPTPVRASSVGNVGGGSSTSTVPTTTTTTTTTAAATTTITTTTTTPSSSTKQLVPAQNQHTITTTTTTPSTPVAVTATSKSSNVSHHHAHSHHHLNNAPPPTSNTTPQSGNFATVAAANVQHHPATSTSYSTKIAAGKCETVGKVLVHLEYCYILVFSAGHLPTENGLPPYSTSNSSSNVPTSSTNSGPTNTTANFNEQHNVSRLSSSPSLSVHSGPSPVPTSSTPTHTEQPALTPMKSMVQNQENSMDKLILDMQHMEGSRNMNFNSTVSNNREPTTTEIHILPILGVAPLGPVPLTTEQQVNFRMMEAAYTHMPNPADSERLRSYLPRNPCTTPSYYPQNTLTNADTLEYHAKLATDTLFFIFYYSEGTKSQYLAAKALKKQSWRFHTKYMMWFQRHEEPRTINEEYEQGTYIYFDYEKWTQRKKEGFTFEYKYLEDRDLT